MKHYYELDKNGIIIAGYFIPQPGKKTIYLEEPIDSGSIIPVEKGYLSKYKNIDLILKNRTTSLTAPTKYKRNGTDIYNYYEKLSSGTVPALTGYKINGQDLNAKFCKK